jgi:putative tryptophan/tyrosine transport system substrate-binding protein
MRLIGLVLLTQSLLLAPLAAHAQQAGKIYRVGHLATAEFEQPDPTEQRAWPTFIEALKSLGWIEGKNFVFERRTSSTRTGIQQAAEDFVRKKVDVIVLVGGARAAMVQQVTRTIPIVTLAAGDLVGSGIVPSLTRPGGNITGMQSYAPEIMGKRLQMLQELNPSLSRVAVLRRYSWHPGILAVYRQATDDAAQKLRIKVRYVRFDNADELPGVFAEMRRERDGAVMIWEDTAIDEVAPQLLDLAVKQRLPTIVDRPKWARTGALIAYGPKASDLFRHAATYVDRILKGAKPAELPIGQPTTFELICNLKTAKALGVTIPQSILLLADQVVE